ncbi:MAG TPA: hypothetical protein VNR00_11020 [Opitutus sp.]|nr:hypothetical protein [Opitutus sp.]
MSQVPPSTETDDPQVPGLRRWSHVYLVVLASFVATVGLLTWFTRAFAA